MALELTISFVAHAVLGSRCDKVSLQVTYPASKRSEIFEQMHESSNWLDIEHDGWHLPATEDKREDCGKWLTKGCLNVKAHAGTQFAGKVFIKTFQKSCFRSSCELCYKKWMGRESSKATRRIEKYEELSKEPPKHIIISVPSWKHYKPVRDLRKEAYRILKKVNCKGGTLIFHPFRYNRENKAWYFSPHFHIIGFGWITNVKEIYNKDGWIVKNKGLRDSVFATFYYQLSHAGIKKHYHTLTWFGDLSYSKLKVEQEPNPDVCPLCSAELRPVYFYGLFGSRPPPETEVELYVEPEGWHILESTHPVSVVSPCLAIYRKHKPRYDMI